MKAWILLLLGLAVLPFVWLKGGYVLMPEEFYFVDYSVIHDQYRHAWNSFLNYGEPGSYWNVVLLWPQGMFFHLVESLGAHPSLALKVFYSVYLLALGAAILYMLGLLTRDRGAVLAGAALYLFNFHFTLAVTSTPKMYHLLMFPLSFAWTLRFLETGKWRFAAAHGLLFFLLQGISANASQMAVAMLASPLAFLYAGFRDGGGTFRYLRRKFVPWLLSWLPVLPVLLFMALHYYNFLSHHYDQWVDNAVRTFDQTMRHGVARMASLFQTRGYVFEHIRLDGVPYCRWAWYYDHPPVRIAGFLLLALGWVPLLRPGSRDAGATRSYLFMGGAWIASVALASGFAFQPHWFAWVFNHVPPMRAFRDPWTKFVPVVLWSQAALLALALSLWPERRKVWRWLLVPVFAILAWPLFTPDLVNRENREWHGVVVKPPRSWWDFKAWSARDPERHLLIFPRTPALARYDWGGDGEARVPVYPILSRRNIVFDSSLGSLKSFESYRALLEALPPESRDALPRLGPLDHLLDQGDLEAGIYQRHAGRDAGLASWFQVEPETVFGRLRIRPILPQYYLPTLFVPRRVVLTGRLREGTARRLAFPAEDVRTAVLPLSTEAKREEADEFFETVEALASRSLRGGRPGPWTFPVEVPAAGSYSVFVLDSDLPDRGPSAPRLEHGQVVRSGVRAGNRWGFGTLLLRTGENVLSLDPGPVLNRVVRGSWMPVPTAGAEGTGPFRRIVPHAWRPVDPWEAEKRYRWVLRCPAGLGKPSLVLSEGLSCRPSGGGEDIRYLEDAPGRDWNDRIVEMEFRDDGRGDSWYEAILESRGFAKEAAAGVIFPVAPSSWEGVELSAYREKVPTLVLRSTGPSPTRVTPQLEFRRLDPTRYRVTVKGAQEPFWLVLNQNYHPGWKLHKTRVDRKGEGASSGDRVFFDGEITERRPARQGAPLFLSRLGNVSPERHVQANGYANAWRILPAEAGGPDFELLVEYEPQRWFEAAGVFMNATALLGLGVLAGAAFRRKRGGDREEGR